jgi:hypothetical protein
MFRHALNPAGTATAPTRSWWAVHVASLTPILLAWKAARVTATLYTGDRAAVDVDDLAAELATFHPSPGQLASCVLRMVAIGMVGECDEIVTVHVSRKGA